LKTASFDAAPLLADSRPTTHRPRLLDDARVASATEEAMKAEEA
jgi:hypothetical protein